MTSSVPNNGQIPTDHTMLAAILTSVLLAKTFTQEEISNLVALSTLALNAIPYLRR